MLYVAKMNMKYEAIGTGRLANAEVLKWFGNITF